MQDELTAAGLDVTIFGLNQIGHESANATVVAGRDLGWLQEVASEPVWTSWNVTWRDVYVLDEDNNIVAIYNLTSHNLADPMAFAELKGLFQAEATD